MGFSEDEKEKLLKIARTTVEQVAKGKGIPDFEVESEALKKECGAFVSIHKGKDLRGCVGFIRACDPLYITVRNAAEAAAARDHRFSPLKKGELGRIKLEISVLSPLKKIENVDEIQVGRDGIVIRKGVNQGLLLPQVATGIARRSSNTRALKPISRKIPGKTPKQKYGSFQPMYFKRSSIHKVFSRHQKRTLFRCFAPRND